MNNITLMNKLITAVLVFVFICAGMTPFQAKAESCASFIEEYYPMFYPEADTIAEGSLDREFTRTSFMVEGCDIKVFKLKVAIKEEKSISAVSSVENFKLQGLSGYIYETEATLSEDGKTLIFDFGEDGQVMLADNPELFIVRADVTHVPEARKIKFTITGAVAKDIMGNAVDLPVESMGKKFLLVP